MVTTKRPNDQWTGWTCWRLHACSWPVGRQSFAIIITMIFNNTNYETWGAKTIANFSNYNTCEPEILWAFRIIGETFCIQDFFEIFKRSIQKRNHLIRCLGFCNWPSRPLTHLSFDERWKICFLFQGMWSNKKICGLLFYIYNLFIFPSRCSDSSLFSNWWKHFFWLELQKSQVTTREK